MDNVCLNNLPEIVGMSLTGVVTVASVLANIVKADSLLGKIVHFAAINIKVK